MSISVAKSRGGRWSSFPEGLLGRRFPRHHSFFNTSSFVETHLREYLTWRAMVFLASFSNTLSSKDVAAIAIAGIWVLYLSSKPSSRPPYPPWTSTTSSRRQHVSDTTEEWMACVSSLGEEIWWDYITSSAFVLVFILFSLKGPITYLTMLGTPFVVLNTLKVSLELMNDRSVNYSGRPLNVIKEL